MENLNDWKYISIRNDLYILIVALLCLSVINLTPLIPALIENMARFLLIFFLPGYAITRLFFYKNGKFSTNRRIILGLFLSLCLVGIWLLIINLNPLSNYLPDYEILVTLIIFSILIVRLIHVLIIKRGEKKIDQEKNVPEKNQSKKIKETVHAKVQEDKSKYHKPDLEPSKHHKPDLEPSKVEVVKIKESFPDLMTFILLGLISALLIYLLEESIIQIPVALFIFLFLPGYSLLSFLDISFKRKKWYLKIISSALLSQILTLTLELSSTYLNYTLTVSNMLLILVSFSLILLVLAYLRRRMHHKKERKHIKTSDKKELKVQSVPEKKEPPSVTASDTKKYLSPRLNIDILLLVLTFLGLIFTFLPLNLMNYQNLLRTIFILPLVSFLPGYCLLRAIFYTRVEKSKGKGKALLVISTVFLSLCLTLIGGGVLNYFNQNPDINIIFLSLITLSGIILYHIQRKRTSTSETVEDSSPMQEPIIKDYLNLSSLDKDEEEIDEDLDSPKAILQKYQNKLLHSLKPHQKKAQKYQPSPEKRMEEKLKKAFDPVMTVESEKIKRLNIIKRSSDLLIILGLSVFTLIFIFTPPLNQTFIRSILGLLFVLFIPGYVLTGALFPKKSDLEGIERLALSFGLSLAITPLIGLALNYTPWGIRLIPIVLSLTIFTFILVFIAILRRRNLAEGEVFHPQLSKHIHFLKRGFDQESQLDKILSVVLVITLLVAVSMTIYIVATPQQGEQFTEFYILGPDGMASDYPTNLTVGESGNLIIGVVNREYDLVNYRLEVRLNDILIDQQNLTLEHEEKWEEEFSFTANNPGANQKLEFLLYKLPDTNEAYRSLHLWVDVI